MKRKNLIIFILIASLWLACNNSSNTNTNDTKDTKDTTKESVSGQIKLPDDMTSSEKMVAEFINYLGEQKFKEAFEMQKISSWGDYKQFSSTKSFGGITKTTINAIKTTVEKETTATVYVEAFYEDPTNGDNTFKENFYLKKYGSEWKIIKLEIVDLSKSKIKAKKVAITPKDYSKICFVYQGEYPKISGMSDSKIEAILNTKIEKSALAIENEKEGCECMQEDPSTIMGWAMVYYGVYINKKILSVILTKYAGAGGGNMSYGWNEIFNIDLNTNKFVTYNELLDNKLSKADIQTKTQKYLKNMFEKDFDYIEYPTIDKLEDNDFFVRNDSLIFAIYTDPVGVTAYRGIYEIPLMPLK